MKRALALSIITAFLLNIAMPAYSGPLQDAAEAGDLDAIIKLHKQGMDLNDRDDFNMTALHFAAYNGHLNVINYLLKNHVELNGQSNSGYTPLGLAIDAEHIEIAKRLVQAGANINVNFDDKTEHFDLKGKTFYEIKRSTALSIAWDKVDFETVRWLIDQGANVNIVLEPSGRQTTLFHDVVKSGNYDMVKLFLEKGADVHALEYRWNPYTNRGRYVSPLFMTNDDKIKQLLRSYGAK